MAVLAATLAGCGAGDGSDTLAPQAVAQTAAALPEASRGDTLRSRSSTAPRARTVVLPAPAARERASLRTPAAAGLPTPRRVGFVREVPGVADPQATMAQLQWSTTAAGRQIAALSVTSPQAQGLRLGVVVHALPAAATIRFYAQGSTLVHEIPAADILDLLQSNRAAGATGSTANTYWSPLVDGPEVTVEIEIPAHVDPRTVALALPTLSHLDELPLADTVASGTVQPKIGEADACNVDVTCRPEYESESRSVARLLFTEDGNSYLCSGTLLKDRGASSTPYLLTANHCISSQAGASSLQTFWFYRSSRCNVEAVSAESRTRTGGATLLYASAATDTSFVRLNTTPPPGVVYAAWSAEPLQRFTSVFGLHHPRGDLQKLSTGTVRSYERCEPSPRDTTQLACSADDLASSQFVDVEYSTGTTESGSSGSPLFRRVDGISYVTGQLYGGSASCQDRQGTNLYGRLDVAYSAGLQGWLDGPAARGPVYRFFNTRTGAHFYTMNVAERDFVIASYPDFVYEGPNFYAYSARANGSSPVYRFYNVRTGAHFFTIDEAEKDYVQVAYPEFKYEGIGWYARKTGQTGTLPLFRFFNISTSTHFYTASADERAYVLATWPVFLNEGVGYYVWPGL